MPSDQEALNVQFNVNLKFKDMEINNVWSIWKIWYV